jgi:hypothetical protein
MIVLVVSLGATVFAFATGGFSSFQNNMLNLFSNSSNQISENVVIEQVVFVNTGSSSTSGATLFMRDVGINPTTIAAVYVQNSTAGSFVEQAKSSPLPVTINSGILSSFTITGFLPKHGTAYLFTASTSLGNSVVLNAKYN